MGNPAPAVAATPHAVSVGKLRAVAWAIARAPAVGDKSSRKGSSMTCDMWALAPQGVRGGAEGWVGEKLVYHLLQGQGQVDGWGRGAGVQGAGCRGGRAW